MAAADRTTGHCLCGNIRFKFDPDAVKWTCHCHCESCRRATASPVTTFISVSNTGWRWERIEPSLFKSSAGVRRYFCETCGTPIAYANEKLPDETHFYAALLIDPSEVKPDFIYAYDEHLPWCVLEGDLPKK